MTPLYLWTFRLGCSNEWIRYRKQMNHIVCEFILKRHDYLETTASNKKNTAKQKFTHPRSSVNLQWLMNVQVRKHERYLLGLVMS